jgi:hypothetical protein
MTLWHSLFWTDITEHIELLVVFSTHEFFLAGCAVEQMTRPQPSSWVPVSWRLD